MKLSKAVCKYDYKLNNTGEKITREVLELKFLN